jgi:flavin-dependent dehydrogenase
MAAVELARQGVSVLIVERSAFPREKICGDGLLEDSLDILKTVGIERAVRDKAHPVGCIRFFAPNGTECQLEGDFCTLQRSQLDALLVEEACRQGASFLDGMQVTEPLFRRGTCVGAVGIGKSSKKVKISASLVLLATGADSRMLGAFGVLQHKRSSGIGVRGYFRLPKPADESAMIISYDRHLLPGYAWIFPMGGGVFNVGCGVLPDRRTKIRELGQYITTFHECSPPVSTFLRHAEPLGPLRAARVRTGFRGAKACAPGLLVLGEALGLTYPLLGEGISSALESGKLAAKTAREAMKKADFSTRVLSRYEMELRQRLDGRHQAYLNGQRWFRYSLVANRLIAKVGRRQELKDLAQAVLHGKKDPRALFSLWVMARILFT